MPTHRHLVPVLADSGQLTVSESELVEWGENLGRSSAPPLIITITGELGAGKTTLAKAICRGYGVSEDVTSPTYSIVQQYSSERSVVYHVDLYRLEASEQLTNIGWEEVVSAHALVIVEWPERAGARMPRNRLPIDLSYMADDPSRRILFAG